MLGVEGFEESKGRLSWRIYANMKTGKIDMCSGAGEATGSFVVFNCSACECRRAGRRCRCVIDGGVKDSDRPIGLRQRRFLDQPRGIIIEVIIIEL